MHELQRLSLFVQCTHHAIVQEILQAVMTEDTFLGTTMVPSLRLLRGAVGAGITAGVGWVGWGDWRGINGQ